MLHRATAHYDGPWALLCDEREIMLDVSKEGSQLGYWAYLYYLSKFYEMLDTVILALKKRPLEFLQMYVYICRHDLGCILLKMAAISLRTGTTTPRS